MVGKNKNWYSEEYVPGHPADRLSQNNQNSVLIRASENLFKLIEQTTYYDSFQSYFQKLSVEVDKLLLNARLHVNVLKEIRKFVNLFREDIALKKKRRDIISLLSW